MNKYAVTLIASVVIWGTTIPPTKWALETIPPFTLSFLRLFLASLILLPYAWHKSKLVIKDPYPWPRLWSLSFTGVGGFLMLGYYGIELTSGIHVSILSATMPLFTILLGVFYLKERMKRAEIISLFLGICGVLIIAIQPNIAKDSSLIGDGLILLSCFVWAVYIVQLKRPQGEGQLTKEWFTAITLFLGSIMMIPLACMEIWTGGLPLISWKAWGCIAYLALFPTIAAYWLWNKGVEHISIARASAYLNGIPIIEIISCIVLLNERVTWRLFLGGCLVLMGVIIIEKNATKKILISKGKEQEYIS